LGAVGGTGTGGACAAYIDLNPVRAGIVKDPKGYRRSGYAEAVAKGGLAVDGLSKLFVNGCLMNITESLVSCVGNVERIR